jgi:hypothetical protein
LIAPSADSSAPCDDDKQEKSLFIPNWDEKALTFRGSTHIPRFLLIRKQKFDTQAKICSHSSQNAL